MTGNHRVKFNSYTASLVSEIMGGDTQTDTEAHTQTHKELGLVYVNVFRVFMTMTLKSKTIEQNKQ